MFRLLYNLLWPIGLLIFLPASLRKMIRRGGYRKDFGQRLGFYSRTAREALRGKRPTWIHAVSVGEIMIALKIAAELRRREFELRCVLTTTTTTGHALALRTAPEWIQVLYTPLDFWPVMRRAFRTFAPERIILVEAEVWPNMVARAKRSHTPIILANARLSPRSERRFRRFRSVVAPIFRRLDLICVPDETEAARWHALGGTNVCVVGNVKYDLATTMPGKTRSEFVELAGEGRSVLLGASTHQGEEKILAGIFQRLREEFSDLQLIIVPRHAERAAVIDRQIRTLGLTVRRRSEAGRGAVDCLLIDVTGELREWLNLATVVFVGKSLTARGGQNPIEAVAANKPVIFGPHMENFAQISHRLIECGGAVAISDEHALEDAIRRLLRDPAARDAMVQRARKIIAPHQGSADRTAAEIERLIGRSR